MVVPFSTMENMLEVEENEFNFGHVEFEQLVGHQRTNVKYKDG